MFKSSNANVTTVESLDGEKCTVFRATFGSFGCSLKAKGLMHKKEIYIWGIKISAGKFIPRNEVFQQVG